MDFFTIIFMGRSGCGKGTQVNKLIEHISSVDKHNVLHLEVGGRFRAFIKEDTYASRLANEISESGGLQPEFLSIWAWSGELVQNLNPENHLIIDGAPRRLSEAKILESVFKFYNRGKIQIVYLNVSKDWAIERMKARGRKDDVEMDDVMTRMNWFDTDVVAALDYYRAHKSHLFHDINGEQSIEDVHKEILNSLEI